MKKNNQNLEELLEKYIFRQLPAEEMQDVEVQLLTNHHWQEIYHDLLAKQQGLRYHQLINLKNHLQNLEKTLPPVHTEKKLKKSAQEGYLLPSATLPDERKSENPELAVEEEQPVEQGVRYHAMQAQLQHLRTLENQLPPVKVPVYATKLKHWPWALAAAVIGIVLLVNVLIDRNYQTFDQLFEPIDVAAGQVRSSNSGPATFDNSALSKGLVAYIQRDYTLALRHFRAAGLTVQDPEHGKYQLFALLGAHKFKQAEKSLLSIPPDRHQEAWYLEAEKYLLLAKQR